jgi:hypothetical protein
MSRVERRSAPRELKLGGAVPLFTENPRRKVFSETKLPEMPILGNSERVRA